MLRILIVEDEPAYIDALEVALGREGFEISSVEDGREGLVRFRSDSPDLVLLDLMLPGIAGLDVLRGIRAESDVPVIILSAKDAESDIVAALELGADDYLAKPYSVKELVARINAAMRRAGAGADEPDVVAAGSVVLDYGRYELRLADTAFELPRKEFELMRMLMRRQGKIVTRETLLDEVWGISWGDSKTLDQHIRRLRRKLERGGAEAPRIETVRGVGYRLEV